MGTVLIKTVIYSKILKNNQTLKKKKKRSNSFKQGGMQIV